MKTLDYIKKNGIDSLEKNFGIKVKKYTDHNLAVLNYNQIESPKFHPVVMECRGLIIDYKKLAPVSRTFKRFFNLNEWKDDPFDFDSSYRVEEKADGSLMSVYWYNGTWNIATRRTAFGESTIHTDKTKTFRDVFISIIKMPINEFMKGMSKNRSYTFELCSLYNKVVKVYEKPTLYLTNIVDLSTGEEFDSTILDMIADILNVKRPKKYTFSSIDEMTNHFQNMDPTDEGFVIIDDNFNRIKVKNPSYVDLHHIKGGDAPSFKRVVNIIFKGETEEVLSYFPEHKSFFQKPQKIYDYIIDEIHRYECLATNEEISQKEFALQVKDLPFSSVLFGIRRGKAINDVLSKLTPQAKERMISFYLNDKRFE